MPAPRVAQVFAAIGDETRWNLLVRLSSASKTSTIADMTEGTAMTRQAVTKHLEVLRHAGLVSRTRRGRTTHYELQGRALDEARHELDRIARLWDDALLRLKTFIERPAAESDSSSQQTSSQTPSDSNPTRRKRS